MELPEHDETPPRGLFLVLEGPEGSGKSTQAALLLQWLERAGIPALKVREPGGTPVAEQVRRILLLEKEPVTARAELLLMLAARATLVEERIRPALESGTLVLADRYALSSLAYQGVGRELGVEVVRRLNDFATGGLEPDLTILLDVPAALGEERRRREGRVDDRIERAGRAFHERVAKAYRLLASTESTVARIDGSRPPETVHREILDLLAGRFPETFAPREG